MVYLKVSFVLSARIIFRNMFFRQFGETFFFFRYFVRIQTAQCTTCKMDTIGRDVFLNTLHSQISCRCVRCESILMLDNTTLGTHISHASRHFWVDDFLTKPVLVRDVIVPWRVIWQYPRVKIHGNHGPFSACPVPTSPNPMQDNVTQQKGWWCFKKSGQVTSWGFLIQPIKMYSLLDIQTSAIDSPKFTSEATTTRPQDNHRQTLKALVSCMTPSAACTDDQVSNGRGVGLGAFAQLVLFGKMGWWRVGGELVAG